MRLLPFARAESGPEGEDGEETSTDRPIDLGWVSFGMLRVFESSSPEDPPNLEDPPHPES